MVLAADDRVLVQAARAGDVDAFAALVRRHQDAVYRVALRVLGSRSDAEDAAQDTFVQAWRGLERFRGDSAVSTWLYRIVTNRCLNLLAARRPTEPLHWDAPSVDDDPAHVAEQRERFTAVTAAVGSLPAEQRVALVLREVEGLSYDEIADVLELSLPAVKGRIHRARLGVLKNAASWR